VKKRILITIGILILYLVGKHIPVFGIDSSLLRKMLSNGTLHLSYVFSLGVSPYIEASITLMLLVAVIPSLERLALGGEMGRRTIQKYIRYATVFIALFQGFVISKWFENPANFGALIVPNPGWQFRITTAITLTAGAMLVMWLGEQVTNYGIGNGISLFILLEILSKLSRGIPKVWRHLSVTGSHMTFFLLAVIIGLLAIAVKYLLEWEKTKVQLKYSRHRIEHIYMRLPLNLAGFLPLSFAGSIWLFSITLAEFQSEGTESIVSKIAFLLQQTTVIGYLLYGGLIISFTFFYTAVVFSPLHLSDKMKRLDVSIPGVEPGKPTSRYLNKILVRTSLMWGLFLFIITSLLRLLPYWLKIPPFNLDGRSIILLVGIMLGIQHSLRNGLKLREVFCHPDLKEILLVKGMLESEGISSKIDNVESYGRLLCLTIGALARKRLLVKQKDYEKAKELISRSL